MKTMENADLFASGYVKPLKRHKALVELSRDHHYGLLLVWKIRHGLRTSVECERISNYLLFYFENDLRAHFEEEEKMLFLPQFRDEACVRKALDEHLKMYHLIGSVQADRNKTELLPEFADLLERHIRFEERGVFPYLQSVLSDTQLAEIEHTTRKTRQDPDNCWSDAFWKKGSQSN